MKQVLNPIILTLKFNLKINTINSYKLFNLFCIYTLRPNALLKYIEL